MGEGTTTGTTETVVGSIQGGRYKKAFLLEVISRIQGIPISPNISGT